MIFLAVQRQEKGTNYADCKVILILHGEKKRQDMNGETDIAEIASGRLWMKNPETQRMQSWLALRIAEGGAPVHERYAAPPHWC